MQIHWPVFTLTTSLALLCGCGNPSADETGSTDSQQHTDEHAHDHGHDHPAHGPHQGELIELGNEKYHAELIHNDQSVTIYILDGSAKSTVPIDATELTVNIKIDGQPQQFALTASPEEGDPEGKSSKFVSDDETLASHLDDHDADARLVVSIDGKSYRGKLAHDHDHGHEH